MKFYIHSSYGVLEAKPMSVQAIENSIPEEDTKLENTDNLENTENTD